jgi:hypothetical protein
VSHTVLILNSIDSLFSLLTLTPTPIPPPSTLQHLFLLSLLLRLLLVPFDSGQERV